MWLLILYWKRKLRQTVLAEESETSASVQPKKYLSSLKTKMSQKSNVKGINYKDYNEFKITLKVCRMHT